MSSSFSSKDEYELMALDDDSEDDNLSSIATLYSLSKILDETTRFSQNYGWFHQRRDAKGDLSISTELKITSGLGQLAYGSTPDALDKYLQISERVSRETRQNFAKCIIDLYAIVYMREHAHHDIVRLYDAHERLRGFPGILESIDCMHWAWAKCPKAWRGEYTRGDHGYPTIMLEAVLV
ncbi:uncharacterized protein [Rutidosis leptorrhynchoides]|uniref:uncharacterized protein n=1 Tax=Rutidosis leptorrhynchoides TaxID=125765 RepID=UPI003A9A6488